MTAAYQGGFAQQPAEPPDDMDEPWPAEFAGTEPVSHRALTVRERWRNWRRSRPFWAAIFTLLGGSEILLTVIAPLRVIIRIGLLGSLGIAVPVVMILCGLMLMFAPHPRLFYASLVLLLALASWITSNLGGYILGMLFGIVGGSLALTWTDKPRTQTEDADAVAQT